MMVGRWADECRSLAAGSQYDVLSAEGRLFALVMVELAGSPLVAGVFDDEPLRNFVAEEVGRVLRHDPVAFGEFAVWRSGHVDEGDCCRAVMVWRPDPVEAARRVVRAWERWLADPGSLESTYDEL
ncbi:MAG: hypothetical protein ACRBI6_16095 [Acidimicrobiales bacterium]